MEATSSVELRNSVRRAQQYCRQVHSDTNQSVAMAWKAGREFRRIKHMLPRGEFTGWKKTDWSKTKTPEFGSDRKIEMYMYIEKGFESAEDAANSASSVVEAYKVVSDRKRPAQDEIESVTFKYEKDLRRFLLSNITQIETGLHIIDGGSEIRVEAGRIDITAEDDNGNIIVIELKRDLAKDVTQILAYMGTIENPDGKPVRGILVANDFRDRVVYAALAVPNITLKRYAISQEGRRAYSPNSPSFGASNTPR